MGRVVRTILVATLIATFTFVPRGATAASSDAAAAPISVQTDGPIRRAAQAVVPSEARLMRQVVATTNESKVFIGVAAGAAIVTGIALLAYGSSSSCKGDPIGAFATGPCCATTTGRGAIAAAGAGEGAEATRCASLSIA